MELSRIDYIALNGGDGLHYDEEILMSMTAKDFNSIARILKENEAPFEVCASLAAYCKTANERFDTDFFIRRCGFNPPVSDLNKPF